MAFNPLNLALRFLLEVAALVAMGYWGWNKLSYDRLAGWCGSRNVRLNVLTVSHIEHPFRRR